jgi:hypothetical protein
MSTDTHVEIKVNGKSVKQYKHEGNTYVEAREGTEYSIRIQNDSWGRKLAVITVDGVNVITGQSQDEGVGEGYIINDRNSIEIKGFRKDSNTVGAFKFCRKGASYCNEKGLKGNNGVIGVRLYGEKIHPIITYRSNIDNELYKRYDLSPIMCKSSSADSHPGVYRTMVDNSTRGLDSNDIQCCCTASTNSAPDFDLGTTWGQRLNDSVIQVNFENEDYVYAEHIVYYDTRENLEKIGVQFKEEKQIALPKAFGSFAKPPKGWKGK